MAEASPKGSVGAAGVLPRRQKATGEGHPRSAPRTEMFVAVASTNHCVGPGQDKEATRAFTAHSFDAHDYAHPYPDEMAEAQSS